MKTCSMTHQHFAFLAEMLGRLPGGLCLDNQDDRDTLYSIAAIVLSRTNAGFKHDYFIETCKAVQKESNK